MVEQRNSKIMTLAQLKSFQQLKKSGKVERISEAILWHLKVKSCTINNLRKNLNITRSSVSAKISELCDKGLIKVDRKFINENGRWVSSYKLSYEGERKRLEKKRKIDKIERHKKFLESEGYKVSKVKF